MTNAKNVAHTLTTYIYTIVGIVLGVGMVIIASILILPPESPPASLYAIVQKHAHEPMLLLIDVMAVFIIAFAHFAARHNQQLIKLTSQFERMLSIRTQELLNANAHLKSVIAEREHIEYLISRAKKSWEATFDAVSDLIILTNMNGNIIRCNRATIQALHTTFQGLIGTRIDKALYQTDTQGDCHFPQEGREIQFPVLEGWFEVSRYPVGLEDDVDGLIFIIRNVTELVNTEAEIRRQKLFFEAVVENSPVAIVTLDNEYRIASCNSGFEALYGYTRDEVIGHKLDDLLVPKQHKEEAIAYTRQIIQHGSKVHAFGQRQRKDGSLVEVEIFGVPVMIAGKAHGALAIYHDITELVRARKEAEAADHAKSEFLANMSHEIRTPMNGIIGMIELALGTNLTTEQRDYLQIASESADALLSLLNDILDFAKIESQKLELDIIDFDMRSMVEGVVYSLAPRAHSKNIEIACLIHHDVPSLLKGDPGRLRQVLVNLVGNAIKFTEKGEIIVQVKTVSQNDTQARLKFSVTDTGIGVPLDRQAAIFDRFVQVDSSTTRRYGGSGLGLAICKQLVELMGGQIGVESSPGEGSTFWFSVNLEKQKKVRERQPTMPVELTGLKVLVVDDNQTNRMILTEILRQFGCRSEEAQNGVEALQMLQSSSTEDDPYRLVLLDMQMPVMDGITTLEKIKLLPQTGNVPVIILTSMGQRGDAASLEGLGCAAYLLKPVRQVQLYEAILAVLRREISTQPVSPQKIITRHTISEQKHQEARLLLAEDNWVNQKMAVALLQKAGYSVDVVENGLLALEALRTKAYSLVLMDVQMPEMDGLEATRHIREEEKTASMPHTPIIAMTAHAMKGDRERCLQAGMDDYITKPLEPKSLFEVIEKWLSKSETRIDQLALPKEKGKTYMGKTPPIKIEEVMPRFGDDRAFFKELLGEFITELPERLQHLRLTLEKKDSQEIAHLAHSLKGVAAGFSAEELHRLAYDLEMSGRSGVLSEANKLIDQMEAQIPLLRAFLSEL